VQDEIVDLLLRDAVHCSNIHPKPRITCNKAADVRVTQHRGTRPGPFSAGHTFNTRWSHFLVLFANVLMLQIITVIRVCYSIFFCRTCYLHVGADFVKFVVHT